MSREDFIFDRGWRSCLPFPSWFTRSVNASIGGILQDFDQLLMTFPCRVNISEINSAEETVFDHNFHIKQAEMRQTQIHSHYKLSSSLAPELFNSRQAGWSEAGRTRVDKHQVSPEPREDPQKMLFVNKFRCLSDVRLRLNAEACNATKLIIFPFHRQHSLVHSLDELFWRARSAFFNFWLINYEHFIIVQHMMADVQIRLARPSFRAERVSFRCDDSWSRRKLVARDVLQENQWNRTSLRSYHASEGPNTLSQLFAER